MKPKTSPTPSDCAAFEELIEAALDGELDPDEATRLDAHIAGCSACSAMRDHANRVKQILHALPQLDCPPHVLASVNARVSSDVKPRSVTRSRYALALAALAACLLVAWAARPTPTAEKTVAEVDRGTPADPLPPTKAELAEARRALVELQTVVALGGSTVGKETLRRGLVEPFEKALTTVGKSKIGEWRANASALFDALPTARRSNKS